MANKKPAKKPSKKKVEDCVEDILLRMERRQEDIFDMVKEICYDFEDVLKAKNDELQAAQAQEEEEEEEEDEGEWVIVHYGTDGQELYFRGSLDVDEGEDDEVWDPNIRKAVVYDSNKYAVNVCQSLKGPSDSDGDMNVEQLPSQFRKKKGKAKKFSIEVDEEDEDESYDPNLTYFISTCPKKPTKKKPRLFYQELGRYDGRWVVDVRRATYYACKKDAQKVFDRLDDVETDDFPERYPPATIVKKNHEKDGFVEA